MAHTSKKGTSIFKKPQQKIERETSRELSKKTPRKVTGVFKELQQRIEKDTLRELTKKLSQNCTKKLLSLLHEAQLRNLTFQEKSCLQKFMDQNTPERSTSDSEEEEDYAYDPVPQSTIKTPATQPVMLKRPPSSAMSTSSHHKDIDESMGLLAELDKFLEEEEDKRFSSIGTDLSPTTQSTESKRPKILGAKTPTTKKREDTAIESGLLPNGEQVTTIY